MQYLVKYVSFNLVEYSAINSKNYTTNLLKSEIVELLIQIPSSCDILNKN